MIWVVTSDQTICRIYQYKKPNHISLLKEINHPENKLKDIDLTSDKPGRYKTRTSTRSAYTQDTDPKEILLDNFAREIANELDQGRTSNAYKKLILISSSRTSGLLNHHLNKHVKEMIINNIHKDLLHLPDHELLKFLQENTQYPDL